MGAVTVFYDSGWRGERELWIDAFDASGFDCVVIWQVHHPFEYVKHPNLVFVPMYDDIIFQGKLFWYDDYNRAKTICFSSELDRIIPAPRKAHFRYFPAPLAASRVDGLRAFLWKRSRPIDEDLIARLSAGTVFDRFTLHDAPDPGSDARPINPCPVAARESKRISWFEDRAGYLKQLAEHNIFFAPRLHEGIGLGFLEAMAMGLCVIAPDTPTHNEYIVHGETGLFYDPENPQPLDFSRAADIGARARQSIEAGHARWLESIGELRRFIACSA